MFLAGFEEVHAANPAASGVAGSLGTGLVSTSNPSQEQLNQSQMSRGLEAKKSAVSGLLAGTQSVANMLPDAGDKGSVDSRGSMHGDNI